MQDLIDINTFLLAGTLLAGMVYLFVFYKRGASDASIESNEILRGLIDDQKAEIKQLRVRSHDLANELTAVKLQVQMLTDRRDYLEQLVIMALNKEFSNDPSLAKTVKDLVQEVKVANQGK